MKFDALLKRGMGMALLSPEESGTDSAGPQETRWLKSLMAPFLPLVHWWLGELKGFVPSSMHKLFTERRLRVRASRQELCIADPQNPDAHEVCHTLQPQDTSGDMTSRVTAKQRCDLVLDGSLVLQRELELPFDAEASLRRVLAFSMDRYTPFMESDVLFDYKLIQRDSTNRKITIKLFVVPREGVAPVIQSLAGMGIDVASMDVALESANTAVGINLLSAEKPTAGAGFGRSEKVLALLALILLLAAVISPFIQRQRVVSHLGGEVEQMRGQLHQAETDRMELGQRIDRMRLIQTRSAAMPAMLDILLELTRLMPDEAWAGHVAIKSGRVRLTGEAKAASELLARLSNSSIFSDPKFEAPLTQNPRTGRERFVISLAVKGLSDGA
jgi:general secretion pathway protein L